MPGDNTPLGPYSVPHGMMVMYGVGIEHPWPMPNPEPVQPFKPFEWPITPSADEIARKVAEALKPAPGKIDPPPSEATRELDAIKAIVQSIEATEAIIRAVSEQLTADEKRRVMRYIEDRYGKVTSD